MTDAETTVRHSLLLGLTRHYGASTEVQINDLMEDLFHPAVKWAVTKYADEVPE